MFRPTLRSSSCIFLPIGTLLYRKSCASVISVDQGVTFFSFLFLKLVYFNWKIITVLWWVLPYISMTRPQVHVSSPILSPPSPPFPPYPSGLSQSTRFECPASCIYMFQCYSLKSSHLYRKGGKKSPFTAVLSERQISSLHFTNSQVFSFKHTSMGAHTYTTVIF